MKKLISLILAAMLIMACFTACKSETAPGEPVTIRIVVDGVEDITSDMKELFEWQLAEDNIKVEFIVIPQDSDNGYAERDTMLTNLRAEIMAGEGPDLFIVPTWDERKFSDDNFNELPRMSPLFPDVNDAMNNRIFYDLDELIAESDNMDINLHWPVIVEAGKNSEGQMVLPLVYSFDLRLLYSSYLKEPGKYYHTLDELANCGDENLINEAKGMYSNFHYIFPNFVDYENEKLLMDEDELAAVLETVSGMYDVPKSGEYIRYDAPYATFDDYFFYDWKNMGDEVSGFSLPNTEGGLTATIELYMAINANSEHPEAAFKVMEIMYSENFQQCKGFWDESFGHDRYGGWNPCYFIRFGEYMRTGVNAYVDEVMHDTELIDKMATSITSARFTSELDIVLIDIWNEESRVLWDERTKKDFDSHAVAEKMISKMEMILAE